MNWKIRVQEENKKVRRLQMMVDLTIQLLYQTEDLNYKEGLYYIHNARNFALALFPDKADAFDLIYKPRLFRVLRERGIFETSGN